MCHCVCLSVCLSICLSVCLSLCISVCLCGFSPSLTAVSVQCMLSLHTCLSVCPSSVCLSVLLCVSLCFSICLSVCLCGFSPSLTAVSVQCWYLHGNYHGWWQCLLALFLVGGFLIVTHLPLIPVTVSHMSSPSWQLFVNWAWFIDDHKIILRWCSALR